MKIDLKVKLEDAQLELESLADDVVRDMVRTMQSLAEQTYEKAKELASKKLHSTRDQYINALDWGAEGDDTWVVTLSKDALHLEDGYNTFEMLPKLAQGPASKVAKDGCILNPKAKIWTSSGEKNIKDIVAGDMVLTHSGKFREVRQLLVRDFGIDKQYITIKYRIGNDKRGSIKYASLSLTLEHPILTLRGWVPAKDLKLTDRIAAISDLMKKCKFCKKPLPLKATSYCLNRKCGPRSHAKKTILMPDVLKKNGIRVADMMKKRKLRNDFPPDWGFRNKEYRQKCLENSQKTLNKRLSNKQWMPEELLVQDLKKIDQKSVWYSEWDKKDKDVWVRQYPLKTGTFVNAGRGHKRERVLYLDFYNPKYKLAIELDGKYWHSSNSAQKRDNIKNTVCGRKKISLHRFPSHLVYNESYRKLNIINLIMNHSGLWGTTWVSISNITKHRVPRKDHIFSKKYDICLDASEHSFCCNGIMVHNSRYTVIPLKHTTFPVNPDNSKQADLASRLKSEVKIRNWKKVREGVSSKTGKFTTMERMVPGATTHPYLKGLVRVREYKSEGGAKKGQGMISSAYYTFRVASEKQNSSEKWVHPGFAGAKIFPEIFKWAEFELELIILDLAY